MFQLFNVFLLLLLAPLLAAFWIEGVKFLASIPNPGLLLWYVLGLLAAVVMGIFVSGVYGSLFRVATHELTHGVTANAFGRRTKRIKVDTSERPPYGANGSTKYEGSGANSIISLAPYCIPILAIPFLVAKPFIGNLGALANTIIDFLIGLTVGFTCVSNIMDFGTRQTDVTEVGVIPSIGFTYTFILFFLVLSVGIILGSYDGLFGVVAGTVERVPGYYRTALDLLNGAADTLASLL